LKRELKNRGLNVTGNKTELAERLQAAIMEGEALDDTAISEELLDDNDDLLNDDELDEEEHEFHGSPHDEDAILKSPSVSETSKSPDESTVADEVQPKKVVLKRKLTTSLSLPESESSDTPTVEKVSKLEISAGSDDNKDDSGNENDKKNVKISQLSAKDRLDLRAKKFGTPVPVAGDAVKLARAERFGIAAGTAPSKASSGKIVNDTTTNVEVLRKRAERFGGSVSTVMNTIENKEKLLKRQERFGAANGSAKTEDNGTVPEAVKTETTEATANNVVASGKTDYAEKAKLRLERFKTAVK